MSPEDKRDRQIIPLSLGFLRAAVEAMQSSEEVLIGTPQGIVEHPIRTIQPAPVAMASPDKIRKHVADAYSTHRGRDYPAEDITPDVIAARQSIQPVTVYPPQPDQPESPHVQPPAVVSFSDRMKQANPHVQQNDWDLVA